MLLTDVTHLVPVNLITADSPISPTTMNSCQDSRVRVGQEGLRYPAANCELRERVWRTEE